MELPKTTIDISQIKGSGIEIVLISKDETILVVGPGQSIKVNAGQKVIYKDGEVLLIKASRE